MPQDGAAGPRPRPAAARAGGPRRRPGRRRPPRERVTGTRIVRQLGEKLEALPKSTLRQAAHRLDSQGLVRPGQIRAQAIERQGRVIGPQHSQGMREHRRGCPRVVQECDDIVFAGQLVSRTAHLPSSRSRAARMRLEEPFRVAALETSASPQLGAKLLQPLLADPLDRRETDRRVGIRQKARQECASFRPDRIRAGSSSRPSFAGGQDALHPATAISSSALSDRRKPSRGLLNERIFRFECLEKHLLVRWIGEAAHRRRADQRRGGQSDRVQFDPRRPESWPRPVHKSAVLFVENRGRKAFVDLARGRRGSQRPCHRAVLRCRQRPGSPSRGVAAPFDSPLRSRQIAPLAVQVYDLSTQSLI